MDSAYLERTLDAALLPPTHVSLPDSRRNVNIVTLLRSEVERGSSPRTWCSSRRNAVLPSTVSGGDQLGVRHLLGGRGIESGHRLGTEVAPAVLPLVVLLGEDHPDEADEAGPVGAPLCQAASTLRAPRAAASATIALYTTLARWRIRQRLASAGRLPSARFRARYALP